MNREDMMVNAHKAGIAYAARENANDTDAAIIAAGLGSHESEAFLAGFRGASLRRGARPLHVIAREISADWKRPYFGAVPYLRAMHDLTYASSCYGSDSAQSIILYFLSNAASWRGETAKRVKAELKAMAGG